LCAPCVLSAACALPAGGCPGHWHWLLLRPPAGPHSTRTPWHGKLCCHIITHVHCVLPVYFKYMMLLCTLPAGRCPGHRHWLLCRPPAGPHSTPTPRQAAARLPRRNHSKAQPPALAVCAGSSRIHVDLRAAGSYTGAGQQHCGCAAAAAGCTVCGACAGCTLPPAAATAAAAAVSGSRHCQQQEQRHRWCTL
jgi:hypothetical protein